MIRCPTCQHEELPGALFCSECGTQLSNMEGFTTRSIPSSEAAFSTASGGRNTEKVNNENISVVPVLYVIDAGEKIPLVGKKEFTIGRAVIEQTILPDIDLSQFHAYEKGVSRMHAAIKQSQQGFYIIDLGSVNGTKLNGRKILPNQPYTIQHGDLLSFGSLSLQVFLHP